MAGSTAGHPQAALFFCLLGKGTERGGACLDLCAVWFGLVRWPKMTFAFKAAAPKERLPFAPHKAWSARGPFLFVAGNRFRIPGK